MMLPRLFLLRMLGNCVQIAKIIPSDSQKVKATEKKSDPKTRARSHFAAHFKANRHGRQKPLHPYLEILQCLLHPGRLLHLLYRERCWQRWPHMRFRGIQACTGFVEDIADCVVVAQSCHDNRRGSVRNLFAAVRKGDYSPRAMSGIGTMPTHGR